MSRRKEVKYLCGRAMAEQISSQLSLLFPTREYRVHSEYFDTQDMAFLNQKLDGDFEKFKLRLRQHDNQVKHFEVKFKKGQILQKFIYNSFDEAKCFILNNITSPLEPIVENPLIKISYNRRSFTIADKFHVSIDTQLEFKDLTTGISSSANDLSVIELKGLETPPWLKSLLNNYNLNIESFSKYAYAMEHLGKL